MSYRFSNVGEKSLCNKIYDHIVENLKDQEFSFLDLPKDIGKQMHVSSALDGLMKRGAIEPVRIKQFISTNGATRKTKIYKFIPDTEVKFYHRYKDGIVRNVSRRKQGKLHDEGLPEELIQKPKTQKPKKTPEQNVVYNEDRSLINEILSLAIKIEDVVAENLMLKRLLNEKV